MAIPSPEFACLDQIGPNEPFAIGFEIAVSAFVINAGQSIDKISRLAELRFDNPIASGINITPVISLPDSSKA